MTFHTYRRLCGFFNQKKNLLKITEFLLYEKKPIYFKKFCGSEFSDEFLRFIRFQEDYVIQQQERFPVYSKNFLNFEICIFF